MRQTIFRKNEWFIIYTKNSLNPKNRERKPHHQLPSPSVQCQESPSVYGFKNKSFFLIQSKREQIYIFQDNTASLNKSEIEFEGNMYGVWFNPLTDFHEDIEICIDMT